MFGRGLRAFQRQIVLRSGAARRTVGCDGAISAQRFARQANGGAEFHHCLIPTRRIAASRAGGRRSAERRRVRRSSSARARGGRYHRLRRAAVRKKCWRWRRRCMCPRRPAPGSMRSRLGKRRTPRSAARPFADYARANSSLGRSTVRAVQTRGPAPATRRRGSVLGSADSKESPRPRGSAAASLLKSRWRRGRGFAATADRAGRDRTSA